MNILPQNGEAYFFGSVFDKAEAGTYFQKLYKETPWQHDEVKIYGKTIITARKMAWYGDKPYVYAHKAHKPHPFSPLLSTLKVRAEELCKVKFNSCLLNLYENGAQGMSWHSDDEKEITPHSPIASLSFGVERRFDFRHKNTSETIKIMLENGSLLIMRGECQSYWKHQLPKMLRIKEPRINLTFRTML
jgi:alkylated DNA repair dioxygenase AlkB